MLIVPNTSEELVVYLFVLPTSVSAILIWEEDKVQKPIYYITKVLMGAKTKYIKIEKLVFALLIAAKKFCHYFQAHLVIVLTDQPLKQFFQWPDTSRRLLKRSIEISEFHIKYRLRVAIKAQVLANFIAEFTHDITPKSEITSPEVETLGKQE